MRAQAAEVSTPLAPQGAETTRGTIVALILIEPECSWCLQQLRALERRRVDALGRVRLALDEPVSAAGPRIHAAAVEIRGALGELRRAVARRGWTGPAFVAEPALEVMLGGIPATPYWLLIPGDLDDFAMIRGCLDTEQITRLFQGLK